MKYSESTVDSICAYLEQGIIQEDAAILAGISKATFYRWLDENESFKTQVELALATYKGKLIRLVHLHATQDGKLAFEILARRWPADYGPTARVWIPEKEETPQDKIAKVMSIINKYTTKEVVVEGQVVSDEPQNDSGNSEQVQHDSGKLLQGP